MANATAITLNSLVLNTGKSNVAESVLDTGTDAVTLKFTPAGDTHNILLKFENNAQAADNMTVKVNAGTAPPAFLKGLGDLTLTVAQNGIHYLVIDSARFMQTDGTISITSTPANGKAQTLKITAIKLPK